MTKHVKKTSKAMSVAGMTTGILSLLFLLLLFIFGPSIMTAAMINSMMGIEDYLYFYLNLFLSFLLFLSTLSFVFSLISISRKMAGKGMAIAGLVISIITFTVSGLVLLTKLLYSTI